MITNMGHMNGTTQGITTIHTGRRIIQETYIQLIQTILMNGVQEHGGDTIQTQLLRIPCNTKGNRPRQDVL